MFYNDFHEMVADPIFLQDEASGLLFISGVVHYRGDSNPFAKGV